MRELGRVLHFSKNRNLIVRAQVPPQIGETVTDEKHQKVGVVKDVFGPIMKPYVSIKPEVRRPERYVGETLYLS